MFSRVESEFDIGIAVLCPNCATETTEKTILAGFFIAKKMSNCESWIAKNSELLSVKYHRITLQYNWTNESKCSQ